MNGTRNDRPPQLFSLERVDSQKEGERVPGLHHILTEDMELEQFAHILHISSASVSLNIAHEEKRSDPSYKSKHLFVFASDDWPLVICIPISQFDRLVDALDCGHLETIVSGLYTMFNDWRREHGEPPRVRRATPKES